MEEHLKQQSTEVIKIVLFGPESTGKTTLSRELANYYNTLWTPEYARDYLQKKWNTTQSECEPSDLLPIAIGQIKMENDLAKKANQILFCDTNLLVTKVFSEIYYTFCDPILDNAAKNNEYDLYFLTDIDVPWEKDDLRDKPNNRAQTFEIFKNALIQNNKPFILISGNQQERLEKAISVVNDLIQYKKMGFSSHDFVQIEQHNISISNIEKQLNIFKNGISKTILDRPALINDGILFYNNEQLLGFSKKYDSQKYQFKLKKFVPASGAASRMFKFLNEFLNEFDLEKESINSYNNRKKATNLKIFLAGIEKFPFYENIKQDLKVKFSDFSSWERDKKVYFFIKYLMDPEYLNYANKPKGILPFHKYSSHIATPIEEHLKESAHYATSNGETNLHFTVSEVHQSHFEAILQDVKNKIETQFKIKININFSFQNKATDTIAVDLNNNPFRDKEGKLVFRPGGHGALIENLNNLDADIIFIKNIDNVIQNHIEEISFYKKALAGILIDLQEQIFGFLNQLESKNISENEIDDLIYFVQNKLFIEVREDFDKFTFENKIAYLFKTLNRPIRICGMVKNEGEAGGGPFWVRDAKGTLSLQIVESAQVETNIPKQAKILASATHFNPVDIVCAIKNYKSEKFDLMEFIDHTSGFIVEKNKDGKELKGYELPGLWNGAMAKWITIFVQVPLVTFNPVKTVNDLLKPAHQLE